MALYFESENELKFYNLEVWPPGVMVNVSVYKTKTTRFDNRVGTYFSVYFFSFLAF